MVHHIILDSDYHDYYDFMFLTPSIAKTFGYDVRGCKTWSRKLTRGISREKQWDKMWSLSGALPDFQLFSMPFHGKCKEMERYANNWKSMYEPGDPGYKYHPPEMKLVVYTDPMQHGGYGKILLPALEAIEKYPDHYCTEYIPTVEIPKGSVSYRKMYIGYYELFLRYENETDWRTNVPNGDYEVKIDLLEMKRIDPERRPNIEEPLFAIDFVCPEYGCRMQAIDYNLAPGMRGQEVDDILDSAWVAKQLALFIEDNL